MDSLNSTQFKSNDSNSSLNDLFPSDPISVGNLGSPTDIINGPVNNTQQGNPISSNPFSKTLDTITNQFNNIPAGSSLPSNPLKQTINTVTDQFKNIPKYVAPKITPPSSPITPTPPLSSILDFNDPRYNNLKDLIQAPSLGLGKFLVQPAYNMASSLTELRTGNPLPKLTIPSLFNTGVGNFVDGSSYQQKYEDAITSGINAKYNAQQQLNANEGLKKNSPKNQLSPDQLAQYKQTASQSDSDIMKNAYQNTFLGGLNDAIMLADPIKSGIGFGVETFAPNSLIDSSITNVSRDSLFDYLSGKKTAEQLGFSPEVKASITEKMKTMTTAQKANFLQGFDLLKAKPSLVGKIFGVTDTEAQNILNNTYGGPMRSTSAGSLPGYRAVPGQAPSFGLSTQETEPVGFGEGKPKIPSSIEQPEKQSINNIQSSLMELKQAPEGVGTSPETTLTPETTNMSLEGKNAPISPILPTSVQKVADNIQSSLTELKQASEVSNTSPEITSRIQTPNNIIPIKPTDIPKEGNFISDNANVQTEGNRVINSNTIIHENGIQRPDTSQYLIQKPFANIPVDIWTKINQGGGATIKDLGLTDVKRLFKSLQENGYTNPATGLIVKGYFGNDVILGTTKLQNGEVKYIVGGINSKGNLTDIRLHGTLETNDKIIGRVENFNRLMNMTEGNALPTSSKELPSPISQSYPNLANEINNTPLKSIQFVSPNVEKNLTSEQIDANMASPSYQKNYDAVKNIYANDGIEGDLIKGKGDWADGGEETYIKEITNDVPEDKRIYSLSKNAKNLRQSDAIDFNIDPKGKDELYRITPDGKSMNQIKTLLEKNGIIFKTIGPDTLYVVNGGQYFDSGMLDKLKELEYNGGIKVKMDHGKATFVTGVEDRNVAQPIYDKKISDYEKKYGNRQGKENQINTISGEPIQKEVNQGISQETSNKEITPPPVSENYPHLKFDENGNPLSYTPREKKMVGQSTANLITQGKTDANLPLKPWKSSNFIPNQNIPFLNTLKIPDVKIEGNTPLERITNAKAKSEGIRNRLINASETVGNLGLSLKLSDADYKIIRDEFQAGTPIEQISKEIASKYPRLSPAKIKKALIGIKNYNALEITDTRAVGGLTAEEPNHLTQMWELPTPEAKKAFNKIAIQKGQKTWQGFGAQPKVFRTYAEGENATYKDKNGNDIPFTPLNKNIFEDIIQQGQQAANSIGGAMLKRGLKEAVPDMVVPQRGMKYVQEGKYRGKPYVILNTPSSLQGMVVHPLVADQLKGYQNERVPSFLQNARHISKETGGGTWVTIKNLPKTAAEAGIPSDLVTLYDKGTGELKELIYNMSLFHVSNITMKVGGWAGLTAPIKGIKGIAQSSPTLMSNKLMQDLLNRFDTTNVDGTNHSVTDVLFGQGQHIDIGTPPKNWHKMDPLEQLTYAQFNRYLPALQLAVTKIEAERLVKLGIDPLGPQGIEQGKMIETLMGKINSRMMNISPKTLRTWSRFLATPQFTLSKFKMLSDAFTKWGKPTGTTKGQKVANVFKHPLNILKGNQSGNFARKAVVGNQILNSLMAIFVSLLATGNFPSLRQTFGISPTASSNITKNGVPQDITFPTPFATEATNAISNPGNYISSRINPFMRGIMEALPYSSNMPFGKNFYGGKIQNPRLNESAITQYLKGAGISFLPIGVQNIINASQGGNDQTLEKIAIGLAGLSTKKPAKGGNSSDSSLNDLFPDSGSSSFSPSDSSLNDLFPK